MKYCSKHNQHFDKKCRPCNLEYQKKWYSNNKTLQIQRSKDTKKRHQDILRSLIIDHLISNPCVDCGESDPIVLDFDHQDSSTKHLTISQIYGRGLPVKTLMDEISKCQIRCSNCHRRRTSKQFNQWRYREFG
jgi:hypothetical protein